MKKLLLFITAISLLSGCSFFESSYDMEKNAEELVYEGSTAFAAEDYKDAIKAYTDLKNWYPFSKYAILAELKIADSHYYLEEYDEAIMGYEEFEKMHPKNEAVPYVIYQIGLCWFEQIDTIDRDSSSAKNALDQFNRLINQFPENQYTEEIGKKINQCLSHLSEHELYVANFYMKTKKYKAALNRYKYLVEHYPGSKESKEALKKIPECRDLAKTN